MMLVELHHCVWAWWIRMMHSLPPCSFTGFTHDVCNLKTSENVQIVFVETEQRLYQGPSWWACSPLWRGPWGAPGNWEINTVCFSLIFSLQFHKMDICCAKWWELWEVDVRCTTVLPGRRWKSWWFLEAVWRWDMLRGRIKTSVWLTTWSYFWYIF